jgi:hypothetical protein
MCLRDRYMVTFTIIIPPMLAYIPAPWILWVCLSWIDTAIPGNIRKPCFSVGSIKLFEFTKFGGGQWICSFWMESHASDRLKHRTKTQHDVYVYTHVIFDRMVLSNDTVQGKTQLQNYRNFSENLNHLNLMLPNKCFFWLVVKKPSWKILVNGKDYPIYYGK